MRAPSRAYLLFPLALAVLAPGTGPGQEPPLRLQGILPAGPRTTLTDRWGTLQFTVVNPGREGRDARVIARFPDQPAVQHGRDVWVPGRASLSTWLPIGPAPAKGPDGSRELQSLLFDRSNVQDTLILPPGEERVRSRLVRYRPLVSTTALMVDYVTDPSDPENLTRPGSRAGRALTLVHTLRAAASLPDAVSLVPDGSLPPTPEAFAGIDHCVVAGNRLARDPAGALALREWVHRGGRLWVMLDLVGPEVVSLLLGDGPPVQVVDRVSLTDVRLHRYGYEPPQEGRAFEEPVELVRVLPAPADTILAAANGWPAAFARSVGRGRIVFTTLGARGWHRDRVPGKGARAVSPYPNRPDLPVALPFLEMVGADLHPRRPPPTFTTDDLQPLLTDAIGYSVVGRPTAAWILGGFVLLLTGLAIGSRRSSRPELAGWLAAGVAAGTAGLFLILAEASRRSAPATVAVAAIADVAPGGREVVLTGLMAAYQPESGPVPVSAPRGGLLDLDGEGLEGQSRRRVQTDTTAWHWEGLELPAGVRTGRFAVNLPAGPIAATARFGPDGVEGTLHTGRFHQPADAVLITPSRSPAVARLSQDGRFASGPADVLPPDQYVAGGVLTDRQERRQEVYRRLLGGPLPEHMENRHLLLAWTEPGEAPFTAWDGCRMLGTALLVVPMTFEPTPPGTRVTVPAPFVACRRVMDVGLIQPTLESTFPIEMRLRFQVPPSVRPVDVDRATLYLQVRGPSRRLTVAGLAGDRPVPLLSADNPVEPIRVDITDTALLRPDPDGGIHVMLTVANLGDAKPDSPWRIDALGLEVVGRTAGGE